MDVIVFPMKVHGQVSWWPEKGEREAIWVSAQEATRLIHKVKLRRLIARFAAHRQERSASRRSTGAAVGRSYRSGAADSSKWAKGEKWIVQGNLALHSLED
jgi:hypothetical protein